jgi:hypothetical protein
LVGLRLGTVQASLPAAIALKALRDGGCISSLSLSATANNVAKIGQRVLLAGFDSRLTHDPGLSLDAQVMFDADEWNAPLRADASDPCGSGLPPQGRLLPGAPRLNRLAVAAGSLVAIPRRGEGAVPALRVDGDRHDARNLWHRHALGQTEAPSIDIEVPLRSAIAAVDLQHLAMLEVADRDRLEPEHLRLATAPGLVSIALQLNQLGKAGDQLGDLASLVIGEPAIGDGNGAIRLAVDIRQDHAWHRSRDTRCASAPPSRTWESGASLYQ